MALSTLELLGINAAAGIAAQTAVNAFSPTPTTGTLSGPTSSVYAPGYSNNYPSGFLPDPSSMRMQAAGLFAGGSNTNVSPGLNVNPTMAGASTEKDWRVKISLADWSIFSDSGTDLISPIVRTNGVIFPYTPSISTTHTARYNQQNLTHSNYSNYFYEGSEVAALTISGDFTVQNIDEGRYLLAAIYFFRAATKMFFGNDNLAGNPPPLVFLDGFGDYYFPHVSCVLTSFQHTMSGDVDYIQIPVSAGGLPAVSTASGQTVRLPTSSQLQVTVQPVYSRKNVYNNFNLKDFAQGKLLRGRGGFF
jgi:hypothetical protein